MKLSELLVIRESKLLKILQKYILRAGESIMKFYMMQKTILSCVMTMLHIIMRHLAILL